MKIYTIGFTKKTAKQFFDLLKQNGVECVVDIRLRPDGQLAGFTKKGDLSYFLEKILNCDYCHIESLAPSDEILRTYRKDKDWDNFKSAFQLLLRQRDIPETLERNIFEEKTCCLLCSEASSERCHRLLVAECLASNWQGVEIIHL